MKFSFKFARNSRSGGRHLGELPSSLVTSMWRQCAQPECGRKFKSLVTSCFFILELHKRSWTEKTQSEVKRKEVLNDLIFLPYSGWAHWRHILVARLLGVLQDGGCQILNFWLLQTGISEGWKAFWKLKFHWVTYLCIIFLLAKRKKLSFWNRDKRSFP